MSDAAFTPGPWRLSFMSDGLTQSIWTDSDGPAHIADVTNGPANARLISAAPEMFEALVKITKQFEMLLPKSGVVHDERQALNAARAALAKARGGET